MPERTAATAPPRAIQKTRQSARRHPIHRAMSSVACPNASRRRGACRQPTSCRLSGRCQRPVVVAYPSLRRTPLATATPRQPGDGPEEKRGSQVCTADCCRWSARTGRKAVTSRMTRKPAPRLKGDRCVVRAKTPRRPLRDMGACTLSVVCTAHCQRSTGVAGRVSLRRRLRATAWRRALLTLSTHCGRSLRIGADAREDGISTVSTPPFTGLRRTILVAPSRAARGSVCNGSLGITAFSRLW